MGKLLQETIRKKGLTITEVSNALNVSRRTIYNWFRQDVISDMILRKLSEANLSSFLPGAVEQRIISNINGTNSFVDEEACWKEKYLALLEQYTKLLTKSNEKKIS